jgi:septum formation protein
LYGIEFVVEAADIDESPLPNENASDYVTRLAQEKALDRFPSLASSPCSLVLAADTCVAVGDSILGKPDNLEDFLAMMKSLSGQVHKVHSGVSLITDTKQVETLLVTTEVEFREISSDEMSRYWQSGEPRDKAGGYAIQGLGRTFVRRIEGSYSNVVGLPVVETLQLLRTKGISAHLSDSESKLLQPNHIGS